MLSLRKVVIVLIGSSLIAFGIDFFLMPIKVLDGGFLGIALIVNYLFHIKVGLTLIICSIPVFVHTWFEDKDIFFHSLYGLFFLSYFIDLLDKHYPFGSLITSNPFAAAICGGVFIGVGFGIMLRNDTSTGGIDLIAKLLARKWDLNVGLLILIMDAVVVMLGGILFSVETFYLSAATISAGGLATSLCTLKSVS